MSPWLTMRTVHTLLLALVLPSLLLPGGMTVCLCTGETRQPDVAPCGACSEVAARPQSCCEEALALEAATATPAPRPCDCCLTLVATDGDRDASAKPAGTEIPAPAVADRPAVWSPPASEPAWTASAAPAPTAAAPPGSARTLPLLL